MPRPVVCNLSALALLVLLGACADLMVTDVHHEPWLTTQRQIKTTVMNRGLLAAPATTTRLFVTPPNSPARQATAATPALERGESIEIFISPLQSSELPAAGSGQCLELKACADSADVVWEGWVLESNNCRSRSYCN
jgi:CARDB protein